MDWKTFVSQVIESLAWPLVVVFSVWQLKDKLSEFLPRLRKFKHKDTELEFAELVTGLISDSKNDDIGKISSAKREMKEQQEFLFKLADISPRSAVLEAFRVVENSMSIALAKAYPDLEQKNRLAPLEMLNLLKGRVLTEEQYRQLQNLRMLRNKAAHMEDFSLHSMPVEAYIDIAISTASRLISYAP